MKKSNIILTLILAWLSVFSLAISSGLAVEWPHIDHETFEVSGNSDLRYNFYVLYDHKITFEYNTTPGLPISMLFILKSADDNYEGNFTGISEEAIESLNPILNIAETEKLEKTDEWRVPDKEIYRIVFINMNEQDAEVTLTLTKDEIGTHSYIFGGVVSVLFLCSVFFILKKRSNLLQNDEPEESINNILDSEV